LTSELAHSNPKPLADTVAIVTQATPRLYNIAMSHNKGPDRVKDRIVCETR
jgi:hypothetical protein